MSLAQNRALLAHSQLVLGQAKNSKKFTTRPPLKVGVLGGLF
jgi:hypothetical protein